MDDFDGLSIPRYVINRLVSVRRLGANVECYFGLAPEGRQCIPDYSVVVSAEDAPALLAQIMEAIGGPPPEQAEERRLSS